MIAERRVDVGPDTVRYLEAGAGAPLVLLHAFPLCADMWRPQLERVSDGWRVLAPDLKGLGPTPSSPALSIDDMAGQVLAWLDVLGIARAVIGGLSMGGYVSFALLRRDPARATALVVASTKATADAADARAARDRLSALVRGRGPAAVAEDMLPKLLGATTRQFRKAVEETVRQMIEGNTTGGIDGAIQAMKERPDSAALLPGLTVPVLVLAGEEDTVIPRAEADAMQRALPDAELVSLPAAGHLANLETPDEFSAALGRFLDRIGRRRESTR